MNVSPGRAALMVVAVSLVLFMASLFMPVLVFEKEPPVTGGTVLFWGWWGLLTGDFPWFANPVYFLALVFTLWRKFVTVQILSLVAIGLGVLSLHVREWYFNEGSGTPVLRLGLAFYFWMGSFIALFIGTVVARVLGKTAATPPPLPSGSTPFAP